MIDSLTHPQLCSELLKQTTASSLPTQISLYSIDCVRKILNMYEYRESAIFDLLDRARLAEATDDINFWNPSYQV